MPTTKLEHAIDAARRGLPVFPQEGKRPRIRQWPTNASVNEATIVRWWQRWPDADIGIALPSDIYVLDADTPNAAGWLNDLVEYPAYATLTVRTGKGLHAYFRVPSELARKTPMPGGAGLAAIEGKGAPGPVTWAGSVHRSGHRYAIQCDAPIARMPTWIRWQIGPPRPGRGGPMATPADLQRWSDQRARVLEAAAGEPPRAAAVAIVEDAAADLRLTVASLRDELPALPTGWGDYFYRAAAYLGPHIVSGGLGYGAAIERFRQEFEELDEERRGADHVLRSIERGLAAGARDSELDQAGDHA